MSDPSDYMGGMALSLSDHDAEALLTGSDDLQEDLGDLAEILNAVRTASLPDPGKDFSHLFLLAASESRLTPIERFANEQITITDDWRPRVMPRLAIGAAALFALVAMSSGLAYAANGAKPGDMLYGLDRAFERVGIGNGGAGERLGEAEALVAGGDAPAGLIHAAEVVAGTPAGQTAVPAIEEAVTRLENGPVGPDSNEAVQALLAYIHGRDEGQKVVGSEVAALAQLIGGRPDSPGKSEDAPGQNKGDGDTDAPGNSGSAPGQNKDQGDDNAPGNSDNAPGQTKDEDATDAPGNSENAPGQTKDEGGEGDAPRNSDNAPGQGAENPGKGPSDGGPPSQGGDG